MKLHHRRGEAASLYQTFQARRSARRRRLGLTLTVLGGIAAVGLFAVLSRPGDPVKTLAGVRSAYARAPSLPGSCLPRPEGLQTALNDIAARFQGKVGIAINQAGCKWLVGVRADEYFPQQSVSKLWVSLSVLDAVDRGQMRLDEPITLRPDDQVVFNQPLRWTVLDQGSLTLPAQTLMQDSLSLSDNMANDKLLWRVGGPDHVRMVLSERKIEGIRFGPGERLLQSAIAGVTWTPDLAEGYKFDEARGKVPFDHRVELLGKYVADPMDGATPAGIASALGRLGGGELLSEQSTALLLDIMAHSKSGPRRLKGGLLPGWKAYHKTGTGQELRGTQTGFNDVALVEAPDGTRYGVAVMIGETRLPNPARLEMMQAVSRALVASHDAARGGAATASATPD
ncbi:beta-lactamase class A [Novosphingobium kunmingense]|uniref:beta-lactamase n=1 Tax=Novosphingobium kunmingense TaxID=1211806 RepID=A0A2N0HK34_9SPHN|nr:serine hydrolase [Novosphingobium kunmingense]PKB19238.1 beta-lactamase class A [Novosphingobium kunmingense]